MSTQLPLRLLILGAHPDDAEFAAGGLAAMYRRLGHTVRMVSVTNGESGHHEQWGPALVQRRRQEAAASAAVIGAESSVWDYRDGYLEPTLELRQRVIAEMRNFQPDLVLTHRTCDYHPDHRAVGHAVRDASYLVTVPAMVPEVPILCRAPVIAYLPDLFTRPAPIAPDVVVDVSEVFETVIDMLACHRSQVFEWLPFNMGVADQVPADAAGQRDWLREWYAQRPRQLADRYREALLATYGNDPATMIGYAEVFEISEYAAPLDAEARQRLFPFLPRGSA